ncbi:hypothetical protein Scep_003901 [Stephania cephalantha]|uniref:F-box protein SKIP5 n=1 Tax=Stephania cephalantha TaxID=152367 RepID=A0AAP0PUU8_9MAGN
MTYEIEDPKVHNIPPPKMTRGYIAIPSICGGEVSVGGGERGLGCLLARLGDYAGSWRILGFLFPFVYAYRYNSALVCRRWCYLACHPRLWLRVDQSVKDSLEPGVFPNIEAAVSAARPGDTISIASGGSHCASNVQIKVPLCLIGGGDRPDDTVLECSQGSDSAFEFLSTCKISNLTVKAELGCCLLHRKGRLIIERCILQCDEHPLDYLSCAIVSTANEVDPYSVAASTVTESITTRGGSINSVSVSRTQIEGGAKAVSTSGSLVLQRVRVIYTRATLLFWFDIDFPVFDLSIVVVALNPY